MVLGGTVSGRHIEVGRHDNEWNAKLAVQRDAGYAVGRGPLRTSQTVLGVGGGSCGCV